VWVGVCGCVGVGVCVWVGGWVCGCVWVGVCCWHDTRKTPDHNDLKLGIVVVLDTLSKPIDFGFKR